MASGFALEQLAAGYPGRPVLADVNVGSIPPGTLVAVVGPNAVGKSTLLKAIAGLRPAQGRVLLEGADLACLPPRERLRRVGYLPQTLPQSTSLVAYESWHSALRAGRSEWSAERREAAIESVVAALGLQSLALRRLDELSGGQRQMVGLAQVIVREPRLLLLDEPTSALDLRWQLQVLQAVRALVQAQGAIGLVAVHDLNLALRFCQQVLVLGGGGVLAAGDPAQVITPTLLQRAYGVQARVERCSQGNLLVLADAALPLAGPFFHNDNPPPPMMRRQGHVPTPDARRYLQRLCYHFTRKISVTYDEHQGQAHFPWGLCVLRVDEQALHFDCSAEDDANLARVQFAIDSHVELFSRKSPVAVAWQAVETT